MNFDLAPYYDKDLTLSSNSCIYFTFIFIEGAQINTCENAETEVEGGSFKYFRVNLKPNVQRVSVEVIDKQGNNLLSNLL